MTFFYKTRTWSDPSQLNEDTINQWEHFIDKSNWRIVELQNGFFQTECTTRSGEEWVDVTRRYTLEDAESAIDDSIKHYKSKLKFAKGPIVVKTFKKNEKTEIKC